MKIKTLFSGDILFISLGWFLFMIHFSSGMVEEGFAPKKISEEVKATEQWRERDRTASDNNPVNESTAFVRGDLSGGNKPNEERLPPCSAQDLEKFPDALVIDAEEEEDSQSGKKIERRILETKDGLFKYILVEESIDLATRKPLTREEVVADRLIITALPEGKNKEQFQNELRKKLLNLTFSLEKIPYTTYYELTFDFTSHKPAVSLLPEVIQKLHDLGAVGETDVLFDFCTTPNDPHYEKQEPYLQAGSGIDAPGGWRIRVQFPGTNLDEGNSLLAHLAQSPKNPSGFDNMIVVAATTITEDGEEQRAFFSNYGPNTVHIAAPGTYIFSTWNRNIDGIPYRYNDGTSCAAPFISGALALMKAEFPTDTPQQLIDRLCRTADEIPTLNTTCFRGRRLNLAKALKSGSAETCGIF